MKIVSFILKSMPFSQECVEDLISNSNEKFCYFMIHWKLHIWTVNLKEVSNNRLGAVFEFTMKSSKLFDEIWLCFVCLSSRLIRLWANDNNTMKIALVSFPHTSVTHMHTAKQPIHRSCESLLTDIKFQQNIFHFVSICLIQRHT